MDIARNFLLSSLSSSYARRFIKYDRVDEIYKKIVAECSDAEVDDTFSGTDLLSAIHCCLNTVEGTAFDLSVVVVEFVWGTETMFIRDKLWYIYTNCIPQFSHQFSYQLI